MTQSKRLQTIAEEPGIFARLRSVDVSDKEDIVTFIEGAHADISQEYKIGERQLFFDMIEKEEKAGLVLTNELVIKLGTVLTAYELSFPETNEQQKFRVDLYRQSAQEILERRKDQKELDDLFQDNLDLYYAFHINNNLKPFGDIMHQHAGDIYGSNTSIDDRVDLITKLNNDMTLLKLLVDQILDLQNSYTKRLGSAFMSAERTNDINTLVNAVLTHAADAQKGGIPETEKWFDDLWQQTQKISNELTGLGIPSMLSLPFTRTNDVTLFTKLLNDSILKNPLLLHFANRNNNNEFKNVTTSSTSSTSVAKKK